MLFEYFDRVSALMPQAQTQVTQGTSNAEHLQATLAMFELFLDQS
jgi:FlaG/FlaF family flagellin (archaellin)